MEGDVEVGVVDGVVEGAGRIELIAGNEVSVNVCAPVVEGGEEEGFEDLVVDVSPEVPPEVLDMG
jgi:hypothetical protein